jgi:hypothetical protein
MPAAELLAEIARLKAGMARAQRTIAELEARADIDPLLDILTRRDFECEVKRSLAYLHVKAAGPRCGSSILTASRRSTRLMAQSCARQRPRSP